MASKNELQGSRFMVFYRHGCLKLSNGQAESRFSELYKEYEKKLEYCYLSGFLTMFFLRKNLVASHIPTKSKFFRVMLGLSIIKLGSERFCKNEELEQLIEELGYKYEDQISTLVFSIGL